MAAKSEQKYRIKESPIEGLNIISPTRLGEGRGFLEDMDSEEYALMGITDEVMDHSVERFARGVLRGLYFPDKVAQGRLFAVTYGRALVVAVDLRPESKTFGASHAVELNGDNEAMIYIPPYFGYGFLTLERDTEVVCNATLLAQDEVEMSGIVWDDEILLIDWQFERYDIDSKYLNISQRDKRFPCFRIYNPNNLWPNRPKKSKYARSY